MLMLSKACLGPNQLNRKVYRALSPTDSVNCALLTLYEVLLFHCSTGERKLPSHVVELIPLALPSFTTTADAFVM